jgi:hypothetical protein
MSAWRSGDEENSGGPDFSLSTPSLPVSCESLIVSPHPDYLDDPLALQNLIDESVMDVDSAGVRTGEIARKFLEGRG